ncbi:MAG: hypothetical protein CM1200mP27_08960 [Chloroflexota bacterium]|nr:MAG: hypothetical protein CM1200mP27_08960 [Chloroflexota bacterium]
MGIGSYSFASEELIACSYVERGEWKIAMLHIESGMLLAIDTPFSEMGRGDIKAGDGKIVFVGGAPSLPQTLVQFDLASSKWWELKKSHELEVDPGYLSELDQWNSKLKMGRRLTPSITRRKSRFPSSKAKKPPLLVKSTAAQLSGQHALNLLSVLDKSWNRCFGC